MVESSNESPAVSNDAEQGAFVSAPEQVLGHLLAPVLFDGKPSIALKGAVNLGLSTEVWKWLNRDVEPKLLKFANKAMAANDEGASIAKFCELIGQLTRFKRREAAKSADAQHRLSVQLGGDEIVAELQNFEFAMLHQAEIAQAVSFGDKLAPIGDVDALSVALRSMPKSEAELTPFLSLACIGQVKRPELIIGALVKMADGPTMGDLQRAGLHQFVEAMLQHAHMQLALAQKAMGTLADIDMVCRALARFHRLSRSVSIIIGDDQRSTWFQDQSALVRQMSDLLVPKIDRVDSEIRMALRPSRDSVDRVDSDLVLEALNHMYILCAARDAQSSLALNAVIEDAWRSTGQSIETLISRNVELLRTSPTNEVQLQRLDASIKLAELRLSREVSDVYRASRDKIWQGPRSAIRSQDAA